MLLHIDQDCEQILVASVRYGGSLRRSSAIGSLQTILWEHGRAGLQDPPHRRKQRRARFGDRRMGARDFDRPEPPMLVAAENDVARNPGRCC